VLSEVIFLSGRVATIPGKTARQRPVRGRLARKRQASEVLSESEEVIRVRRQVGRIYAERTGQTLSRISRDMDRDQFMSARQAKDYGIVDQVAVDTKWSTNS